MPTWTTWSPGRTPERLLWLPFSHLADKTLSRICLPPSIQLLINFPGGWLGSTKTCGQVI